MQNPVTVLGPSVSILSRANLGKQPNKRTRLLDAWFRPQSSKLGCIQDLAPKLAPKQVLLRRRPWKNPRPNKKGQPARALDPDCLGSCVTLQGWPI